MLYPECHHSPQSPSPPWIQVIIYCLDYQSCHLSGLSASTLSLLKSILFIAERVMLFNCMSVYAAPLLNILQWLSSFFLKWIRTYLYFFLLPLFIWVYCLVISFHPHWPLHCSSDWGMCWGLKALLMLLPGATSSSVTPDVKLAKFFFCLTLTTLGSTAILHTLCL